MDDDDRAPGAPEWTVTFADMMSLLLTFFILLVSMSELKQVDEFRTVLDSVRLQFGQRAAIASLSPSSSQSANSTAPSMAAKGRAKRSDILQGVDGVKSPRGEDSLVRAIRPAHPVSIDGTVFFADGDAVLNDEAKQRLRAIASEISAKPQRVEVRGHASRSPAVDEQTLWTLASERASVVKNYLVELGIDSQRIRLGSAGANEPLDSQIDSERRQWNARVEVLLWDEPVTRLAAPE